MKTKIIVDKAMLDMRMRFLMRRALLRHPTTRRLIAAGATMAALVFAGLWALTMPAAAADPPVSGQRRVLNDVHTDALDVRWNDGQMRLQTRIGYEPFEYEDPARIVFQLRDTPDTQAQVPDDPAYAFLGPPGTPVWLAPETQNPAVIWPGFDTESIAPGTFAGDTVDLHLRGVSGPGTLEVFSFNPDGTPARIFSANDPAYTTKTLQTGVHVHTNWSFTALGWYTLTFEATATTPGGDKVSSGTVAYTWYVGGVAATDLVPIATTASLTAAPAGVSAGDQLTLTTQVTPPGADGWAEFLDGATPLGTADVVNGTATLVTSGLGAGDHTLTSSFIPRFGNHYAPATTPTLPFTVAPGPGGSPTTSPSTSRSVSASASPSLSPSTAVTTPPVEGTTTATTTAPADTPTPGPSRTTCVPTTSTTTGGVVLDQGHVDYAARVVNGQLVSQIKDGTKAGSTVWRSPADVVFHLTDQAAAKVPSGPFDFIGPANAPIWQIPQTQQQGVLWAGWNTEEITTAQVTGSVTWKLTGVNGPGALSIFEYDSFGQPKVIFNSKDGLPDTYAIPLGTHAHGNWVFTAAGAYRLTFTQSATLASGKQSSTTQVVTFAVGNTDPKALLPKKTTTTGCGSGSRLPTTGVSLQAPLYGGLSMLAAGVALVTLASTRRRPGTQPTTHAAAPDDASV
ncbi:TIGR03773 family transporter-associated surface protein [Dactylosporangium sp. CA-233914]|uniref:TIGR03773 family transporter-associated surface protein n=1 Tax=Dactylosporangium sp. CA-233914 TaxID=3239934 RepID=UPI003D933D40